MANFGINDRQIKVYPLRDQAYRQHPGSWQPLNPGLRRAIHGPIQSMDEDRDRSFWKWLFRRG